MNNQLLTAIILITGFSVAASPASKPSCSLYRTSADTVCRDSTVCKKGDPFNLNLLCQPAGGIYYGSAAILGDQFNPVAANTGANMVYHGFTTGADTIKVCSFNIMVADTVSPAGSISGADAVCRGTAQQYSVAPVEHATAYFWSFSGSAMADSMTTAPVITLFFDPSFSSGALTVYGMNDICMYPGIPSAGFFIRVNQPSVATIRNEYDTLSITDDICKNSRVHYYVFEVLEKYRWVAMNGKIAGDSSLRQVTVDWGPRAGNGSLTVQVEDNQGCMGSAVRDVHVLDTPAPDPPGIWLFGHNLLVCSDSAVNSYQWYNDNVVIQGATKRYYPADTNNRNCYTVQTCLDACCNRSDPFCFHYPASAGELSARSLVIFPNPATDRIQLRTNSPMQLHGHLYIFNSFGALVKDMEITACDFQIDLTLFGSGLYNLVYSDGSGGCYAAKVIKL
ncbi:MAG: hypothetical protein WCK34_05375 [Bacteroidota bacterium]